LSPALFLNVLIFFQPVWYYKGPPTILHRMLEDLHSGLSFTSLAQIRGTVSLDDTTLREIGRLSREWPGNSTVVWESGVTSWRKINYYFAGLPVIVLENKTLQAGSRPIATMRRGPSVVKRFEGTLEVRLKLTPGTRLIWVVNPNTSFYAALHRAFPLQSVEGLNHMFYSQLDGHGEARIGGYSIYW
jgi:hypothetical protein